MAYPSLIITYLGQASWLLHNPDGYAAVFYNCVPERVFWPVFIVSVAAAVVASQVGGEVLPHVPALHPTPSDTPNMHLKA